MSAMLPKYAYSAVKRLLDISAAILGLTLLSPILACIWLLLRLAIGKPAIFRQLRPGQNGQLFPLYKFRTMLELTDTEGRLLPDANRLCPLGRFLRNLSLDELPTLVNVLKGEMSLVGPRPLLSEYLPLYSPQQARRHTVKPGITGWAQVNGRNAISWETKFDLDLWYVENKGFLLDLKILVLTVVTVLLRDGIAAHGSATMPTFKGSETMRHDQIENIPVINLVTRNSELSMSSADIDESDVQAVAEVVRSGRLSLGNNLIEFERLIADYIGVKNAVAMSSGTAALHAAIKALGIGQGDEVLVPSFTFAASVNSILFEGATPVFVEIDPETYNLDPADAEKKVTQKTKAILAVDVFGHPVEWDAVLALAKSKKLKIIDDSCEAIGSEYKGRKVGQFGDAATFAFYPNKQITTGEGGILVTNDDHIACLARSFRNQGRAEMGQWLEHDRLGYNFRMDEMSAALGISQLKRIDSFLQRREHVARSYTERLNSIKWLRCQVVKPHVRMSWFVFVITLAPEIDRDLVMKKMGARGIPTRAYFAPIHRQAYLKGHACAKNVTLNVTDNIASRTIALPFHNRFSDFEIMRVVSALKDAGESSIIERQIAA